MASAAAHLGSCGNRLRRIVFGTDFSPVAMRAASYAMALADSHSARVDLVHVFDSDVYLDDQEPRLRSLEDRLAMRSAKLRSLAATFTQAGIPVKTELPMVKPGWSALLESAEKKSADLILMATRSKPQLKRMFLGSTVEELIRHAKSPILIVGPNVPEAVDGPLAFQCILYATDFAAKGEKAARSVLMLALHDKAKVFVCHVIQNQPEGRVEAPSEAALRPDLERWIQQSPLGDYGCEPVLVHGESAPAILALAEKIKADLIVLGPRKHSFLLTHVKRGVTLEVLAQARCPVLTVQE